jgi:RNA polymerase sigma factor (sigma-70 family)
MSLSNKDQDYNEIIAGLKADKPKRLVFESKLYTLFDHLIKTAVKKYQITEDEAVSAYSDTILQVIQFIQRNKFDGRVSLATFVYQVFIRKCIDMHKVNTKKNTVNYDSLYNSFDLSRNDIISNALDVFKGIDELKNKVSSYLQMPDSVILGASAPSKCPPGDRFTARFVAYLKSVEKHIEAKVLKMSKDATMHLDIKRCRWAKGTLIKVKAFGDDLSVDPAFEEFTWEGPYHILDFDVLVTNDVSKTKTILKFDVLIDDIVVARLRVDLKIAMKSENTIRQVVKERPIETAFASYASQDRPRVLDRLAEIRRIGIDVYLDCLSMRPGEKWKAVLEKEIRARESFLLFWSVNAKNSPMVTWEWQTALKYKGIDKIDPHPLFPVEEAEPPEELKELHFSDVYMTIRKDYGENIVPSFLNEGCRKILLLFIDGYTDKEIADQMGLKPNTIKTTRNKCLEKLRQLMAIDKGGG